MSEKAILAIVGAILAVILLVGGAGVYFVKFNLIRKKEVEIKDIQKKAEAAEAKSFLLVPKHAFKITEDVKLELRKEKENWTIVNAYVDKLEKVVKSMYKPCPTCQSGIREMRSAGKTKNKASALAGLEKLGPHYQDEALHPDRSLQALMAARAEKEKSLEGGIPNFRGEEKPGEVEADLEYDAFTNMIERVKRQSGIAIATMRWIAPKRATGPGVKQVKIPASLHKADFEVVCVGGFYNLLRFLNLLETAGRHIVVENFQIAAGKSTGMTFHSMKVNFFTFAYQGTGPKKDAAGTTTTTTTSPPSREMPD